MKDNEIIKALECCNGWDGRCLNCPLKKEGTNCKEKLSVYALDLINRQKVEIERLSKEIITLKYDLQVASEESLEWKTRAIKEFAERLKNDYSDILHGAYGVEVREIKNLVKEMTEVDGK